MFVDRTALSTGYKFLKWIALPTLWTTRDSPLYIELTCKMLQLKKVSSPEFFDNQCWPLFLCFFFPSQWMETSQTQTTTCHQEGMVTPMMGLITTSPWTILTNLVLVTIFTMVIHLCNLLLTQEGHLLEAAHGMTLTCKKTGLMTWISTLCNRLWTFYLRQLWFPCFFFGRNPAAHL